MMEVTGRSTRLKSESMKEEGSTMLRLRLLLLALASSMLMTLTGCRFSSNSCDEGPMFPRLFQATSRLRNNDAVGAVGGVGCECQTQGWPAGMGVPHGQGPFLVPGSGNPPIPITNVNTPPSLLKVPNATPTPFVP